MNKKITILNPKKPKTPDVWVNNREGTKRLTIDIPASLHAELKIYAARYGASMAEIIIDHLTELLK